MPLSTQLGERLNALRDDFLKATALENPTSEDLEKALKMNSDLVKLEAEYDNAKALDEQAETTKANIEAAREAKEQLTFVPFNGKPTQSTTKSISSNLQRVGFGAAVDAFLESPVYKGTLGKQFHGISYTVEIPGTLKAAGDPITSGQFGPRTTDQTVPAHYATMPTVFDLFRVVPVSATGSIRFYQATMPPTGSPAFIAEAAAKPEVQLRWAPVDAPIETVGEWTAVTLQALDDVPQLRAVLEDDLRTLLLKTIDDKLLNGTGTPPEIRGVLNTSGIGTVSFTTDALTTINGAITQVISSGAGYPTGIVMNQADWSTTRMLTSNGIWYFGGPADAGVQRLFGIPVVVSTAMPAGFALVGDFTFGTIFERWGITFIVGLKNDDLVKNQQTIVCEARLALAIRRPSAFSKADIVTP